MAVGSPNFDIETLIKHIYDTLRDGKPRVRGTSTLQALNRHTLRTRTPIEREPTLKAKLPILNSQNQAIPPAIPLLPLHVLQGIAIYKVLKVQINWDHYEHWARSAEIFRALENESPSLKALRERDAVELLYLLFHLSLVKNSR